jgi:polyadenylation factor subunit 2
MAFQLYQQAHHQQQHYGIQPSQQQQQQQLYQMMGAGMMPAAADDPNAPTQPLHHPRIDRNNTVFDGKRMRQPVSRKYIDYNATILNAIHNRLYDIQEYIPPHPAYSLQMLPPSAMIHEPASSITTKFAHASTNKVRCPIYVVCWTPEGRRMITGAKTGEFTLWNGMAFNFETIQQAHSYAVRSMVWSHNGRFMASSDTTGVIKYWQSNMNNLKEFQGHSECISDLSFCCTDIKFASCSDDASVKVWDFEKCVAESTMHGHGSNVTCCDWHPHNSLIATGSKDYLTKLWDARTAQCAATLYAHKELVSNIKWNSNGNWLLSCSKDQLIKMFDIRYLKDLYTFRGHTKDVACLAWHPFQENLFASGAFDGSIYFWIVGDESPQARIPNAHDNTVWDIAWHPLGHILCSGSNDHTTKFWVRNRPGDTMRDKYNISQLSVDEINKIQSAASGAQLKKEGPIPVPMGGLSKAEELEIAMKDSGEDMIPGLY